MKTPANRLLALMLLAVCAIMCACSAPENPEAALRQQRLVAIGDRLLAYGERKGIITKEDAAFAREIGTIVVTPPPQPQPPTAPTIDTTSGK